LTVSADFNGGGLTVTGNNDLVTLVVTGAKIGNVTLQDNTDLETVTLDHTTDLAPAVGTTAADAGATVSITGNTNMTSLTWSADDVDSLTVTGNTALTTINFEGLVDAGTATAATVAISNNGLVATEAKDTYNAATATDLGSFTSTSGMSSLNTYLAAAVLIASATGVKVFFDEVEAATSQSAANGAYADTSTTIAYTSGANIGAVVYSVDDSTDTEYQTDSYYLTGGAAVAGTTAISGFDAVGDYIEVDYPVTTTARYRYASTSSKTYTTVDSFMTYFNTAADNDNFDLTLTQNGAKQHTFLVNYRETTGAAGSIQATGTLYGTFGTSTFLLSAASVTLASVGSGGYNDLAIAKALADGINDISSYTASAGGSAGYSYVIASAAEDERKTDVTPVNRESIPTSLSISKTGGSVSWSANATNAETSYTLSIGSGVARYAGFILTAKNLSSGSDRSLTAVAGGGYFGTVSKLSAGSFYGSGNVDGKSTTTVESEIGAYVRTYAQSAAGTAATTAVNRLAWL
jgi:hypothetical protein